MTPASRPRPTRAAADQLHSAAIHLLRRLRQSDVEAPTTAARLSALSVLVYGGVDTLSDLADAEQVSRPTISRMLKGMEQEGLIRRFADPVDGRVVHLRATARGRRILSQARSRRLDALEALLQNCSLVEVDLLDRAAALIQKLAQRPSSP
jgi:DNA-binding MarR family transcriptional regulator